MQYCNALLLKVTFPNTGNKWHVLDYWNEMGQIPIFEFEAFQSNLNSGSTFFWCVCTLSELKAFETFFLTIGTINQ